MGILAIGGKLKRIAGKLAKKCGACCGTPFTPPDTPCDYCGGCYQAPAPPPFPGGPAIIGYDNRVACYTDPPDTAHCTPETIQVSFPEEPILVCDTCAETGPTGQSVRTDDYVGDVNNSPDGFTLTRGFYLSKIPGWYTPDDTEYPCIWGFYDDTVSFKPKRWLGNTICDGDPDSVADVVGVAWQLIRFAGPGNVWALQAFNIINGVGGLQDSVAIYQQFFEYDPTEITDDLKGCKNIKDSVNDITGCVFGVGFYGGTATFVSCPDAP